MNFAVDEIALYDLSNRPASFDFITFLATATGAGAKHVRFVLGSGWKKKNYTVRQAVDRFISIVEPAVQLYGIDYSIGERVGVEYNHLLIAATTLYREKGRIGKIILPTPSDRNYVTITLRQSRNPERDSKEDEWIEFARNAGCPAVFIDDWDIQPIPLMQRWNLIANAKMNFGVINGPSTLCFHSNAPYICMRTIGCDRSMSTSPAFSKINGIVPGFQFPWANEDQHLSYLDDTAENIAAEWDRMQEKMKRAA